MDVTLLYTPIDLIEKTCYNWVLNMLPKTMVKVILTVRILACGIMPLELRPIVPTRILFGLGDPFVVPTDLDV